MISSGAVLADVPSPQITDTAAMVDDCFVLHRDPVGVLSLALSGAADGRVLEGAVLVGIPSQQFTKA